jgi:glycosyltransferase involved in cell wall biosynthesis
MSDVVLVPLQAGTGTSRKTLEALAFGKPILGTGMGFRGIPVSSGLNGIVADDLASWPELVRKLVADVELRRTLAVEARELAQVFDYRVVYERYAEIIWAAGRGQDRPARQSPCQRGPG